ADVTHDYPLSLHGALPIYRRLGDNHGYSSLFLVVTGQDLATLHEDATVGGKHGLGGIDGLFNRANQGVSVSNTKLPSTCPAPTRSEEHTSELQSRSDLVCR